LGVGLAIRRREEFEGPLNVCHLQRDQSLRIFVLNALMNKKLVCKKRLYILPW
jgi:hypothetical protein